VPRSTRTGILFLSLWASTATLQAADATIHPTAISAFRKGVKAHDRGDLPLAAQSYRVALSFDASLVSAAINLGIIYEAWHDTATARKFYDEAARVAPHSFAARYNRGQFLQKQGDFAAARHDYEAAVENSKAAHASDTSPVQKSDIASIYVNLAAINIRLFEQERSVAYLAAAEKNLATAEKLGSRSAALYFNRAQLMELKNFPARARSFYEEAMRRYTPQSVEYNSCLARADRLSRQLGNP